MVAAIKKVGQVANADETKYTIMSPEQNGGRSHNIKIDSSPFESVEEFKYFGNNSKYKKSLQEEIKSRLKSGNACYHSVQNLFSSSLLSKDLEIKICRNIIWPVVLYGCETRSLTFREVRRLRVCEKRVLMRIFGLKGDEVRVEWRKLHMEELNVHSIFFRMITSTGMWWADRIARMGEYRGVYRISVGKPEEKRPLAKPRSRTDDNIMTNLQEV